MDQLDFKILNILLEDIRTPIKTIAERVFLSQAAVSQRISAMRSNGILLPSHAAIDPAALGYHFRCFIDIRVPSGLCAEFEAYLRNSDNIIEATYTTGENTAFIKAAFCSTEELTIFLKSLAAYGETNTRIALDSIVRSRGLRVPRRLHRCADGEEDLMPPQEDTEPG